MSREILAFGLFAGAAAGYALTHDPRLALAAAALGVLGVLCSAMIYAATRRSHWSAPVTAAKFAGTSIVLGVAAALALGGGRGIGTRALLATLLLAAGVKLLCELAVLRHLRERQHTVMKRVALLMVRDLHVPTFFRFVAGALGGVAIPGVLLAFGDAAAAPVAAAFALLLAGELLERYLFFRAAPPSRMPGGLV